MQNESFVRLFFFFTIFFLVAGWEIGAPRRRLTVSKRVRWMNNVSIIFLYTVLIRLIFSATAIGMAIAAEKSGWGLLHYFEIPFVPAIVIGVLLLDLSIYLQHLMFHAVPLLWRIHMMHHVDLDLDVTTGLRFHPIEIIISTIIKISAVSLLGPPVAAVLIFEITLNGTAMFNHGNIYLPEPLDRILRLFVVTPDMHRVHHSVIIRETNSNFGFNLPWWDRLFGTYRTQPVAGHEDMTIGLSHYRKPEQLTLLKLIMLPFTGEPGKYSLNSIGQDPEVIRRKSEHPS